MSEDRSLEIEWVPYSSVEPNDYNPNLMGDRERILLITSLLEDGWTMPLVIWDDPDRKEEDPRIIIDGEQRWTAAGMELPSSFVDNILHNMRLRREAGAVISESIYARLTDIKARLEAAEEAGQPMRLVDITEGLVPITYSAVRGDAHRMLSTIRLNRARGQHDPNKMAQVAGKLRELGLSEPEFEARLGMPAEELNRLLTEQVQFNDLSGVDVTEWNIPQEVYADPDYLNLVQESMRANQNWKDAEVSRVANQDSRDVLRKELEEKRRQEVGRALTQQERRDILKSIERPLQLEQDEPEVHRYQFLVTKAQGIAYRKLLKRFSPSLVQAFVILCKKCLEESNVKEESQASG